MKTLIFVCRNFDCHKVDNQISIQTEEKDPIKWCLKCGKPLIDITNNQDNEKEKSEKLER